MAFWAWVGCLDLQAAGLINREQAKEEVRGMVQEFVEGTIEDAARDLAQSLEDDFRQSHEQGERVLQEFFRPLSRIGIDVKDVHFSTDVWDTYCGYAEANEKGELLEKLQGDLSGLLYGQLDQESQDILESLQGVIDEGLTETQNILHAVESLDAIEETEGVDQSDLVALLERCELDPRILDSVETVEQTYVTLEENYGEHWQAFQTVRTAMNSDEPADKIKAFFSLGEQYGAKVPMIGKFIELYFKVAHEYLNAVQRLGHSLRRFDQGCLGTGSHGFMSKLPGTRNFTFSRKFPGITACPHGSDKPIYKDIYIDIEETNHLFFFMDNQFKEGNPNHRGLLDIMAIRRWLMSRDYTSQAEDLLLVVTMYNTAPGFLSFTEEVKQLCDEVYAAVVRVKNSFPGCQEEGIDVLRKAGLDWLFAKLDKDLDLLDNRGIYEETLYHALIEDRYFGRRAGLHEKCRTIAANLEAIQVVRVFGSVMDERDSAHRYEGMTVTATPGDLVFAPCSRTTTARDGSFELLLILKRAEATRISLRAGGGGAQSGTESIDVAPEPQIYTVNLFVSDGASSQEDVQESTESLQAILDQMRALLARTQRTAADVAGTLDQADGVVRDARDQVGQIGTLVQQIESRIDGTKTALIGLQQQMRNASGLVRMAEARSGQAALAKDEVTQATATACRTAQALERAADAMEAARLEDQVADAAFQARAQAQRVRSEWQTARSAADSLIDMQSRHKALQTALTQMQARRGEAAASVTRIQASLDRFDEFLGTLRTALAEKEPIRTKALSLRDQGLALVEATADPAGNTAQLNQLYGAIIAHLDAIPTDIASLEVAEAELRSQIETLDTELTEMTAALDALELPQIDLDRLVRDADSWASAAELFVEPAASSAQEAQRCAQARWTPPEETARVDGGQTSNEWDEAAESGANAWDEAADNAGTGAWDRAADSGSSSSNTVTSGAGTAVGGSDAGIWIQSAKGQANPPLCNYDLALQYLRRAREIDPNHPELNGLEIRMTKLRNDQALAEGQLLHAAQALQNGQLDAALNAARSAQSSGTWCERTRAKELVTYIQNQKTRTTVSAQRQRNAERNVAIAQSLISTLTTVQDTLIEADGGRPVNPPSGGSASPSGTGDASGVFHAQCNTIVIDRVDPQFWALFEQKESGKPHCLYSIIGWTIDEDDRDPMTPAKWAQLTTRDMAGRGSVRLVATGTKAEMLARAKQLCPNSANSVSPQSH